jgi:hypothetical protein
MLWRGQSRAEHAFEQYFTSSHLPHTRVAVLPQ